MTRSPFDPDIDWLMGKKGVKWGRPGRDVLSAWVADMDFQIAPGIRRAIEQALARGDLGYPDWPENPLAEPFARRMQERYGWSAAPGWVRSTTDLIQGLQAVLWLATRRGDPVVMQTPNYPPFLATVETMERTLIELPMQRTATGWDWDLERLEERVRITPPRVLVLVNPHNPTGHVLDGDQLAAIADFAVRHDLIVVSDEIHADLTYPPHVHTPLASLGDEIARRTVTLTSATKSHNIAGLRTAVAHLGPSELRAVWDRLPPDLLGAVNVVGVEATLAAWNDTTGWLESLLDHLDRQRARISRRLYEMTGVTWHPPMATYLAWLDCTRTALGHNPASTIRQRARVQLSEGSEFGPGGAHHVRLNFATSTHILDTILDRIAGCTASGSS